MKKDKRSNFNSGRYSLAEGPIGKVKRQEKRGEEEKEVNVKVKGNRGVPWKRDRKPMGKVKSRRSEGRGQ